MTSRININRSAQSAPQPSYQPSVPMSSGGGHRRQQSTMQGLATTLGIDESQLEGVKKVTSKVEDAIENLTHPIKPYLPALSRYVSVRPSEQSLLASGEGRDGWPVTSARTPAGRFDHLHEPTATLAASPGQRQRG